MENLKNRKQNSKFVVVITEITTMSTRVATCVNYTIWTEASVLPGETDTADNTFMDGKICIKILGDGVVDASGLFDLNKDY